MFMGWDKQIKDCQGSIPTADGKGQGFIARVEMTLHWTMSEMMDHLASYSIWTEAEPQLRKQVNKWVQIQCRQGGTQGKWRLCKMSREFWQQARSLTLSLLMMTSVSDYLKLDRAELMKWIHAHICFSNVNDKWIGDDEWCGGTYSRNSDHESWFQEHVLKTSLFCLYFRFFWEKASVISNPMLSVFLDNRHISDSFRKLCSSSSEYNLSTQNHSLSSEQ